MNTTIVAALTSAFVVMAVAATFSANAQGRDIVEAVQSETADTCEKQIWPAYNDACLTTISGEPSQNAVRVIAQVPIKPAVH